METKRLRPSAAFSAMQRIAKAVEIAKKHNPSGFYMCMAIGRGSSALLYKCTDLNTSQSIVVKMHKPRVKRSSINYEHQIHKMVTGHKNIVQLYSTQQPDFCLECCDYGSAMQCIKMQPDMISRIVYYMARDILAALEYCHMRRIVHCDVTPANILLSNDKDTCFRFKLGDFGLSEVTTPNGFFRVRHVITTLYYRPPEVFCQQLVPACEFEFTPAVDIWALAMSLAHAAGALAPFFKTGLSLVQMAHVLSLCREPWAEGEIALAALLEARTNYTKFMCLTPTAERTVNFDTESHKEFCTALEAKNNDCFLPCRQLDFPELFATFIHDLLRLRPVDRPSASAALTHTYIVVGATQ
jgi:serine/threonine protein kinase